MKFWMYFRRELPVEMEKWWYKKKWVIVFICHDWWDDEAMRYFKSRSGEGGRRYVVHFSALKDLLENEFVLLSSYFVLNDVHIGNRRGDGLPTWSWP